MQVCTLLQTDNHASTPPLSFLQAGCPSCHPTNSVIALKAILNDYALYKSAHELARALKAHSSVYVCQVLTSVVMAFCFSFVRVSVSSVLRREAGRSHLLYCGVVTQLGAFCGALVSFSLVAVAKVFQRMSRCVD